MPTDQWPTEDVIGPFEDEYRFLSNFAQIPVRYDGKEFSTAEHAYQAAKAWDEPDLYDQIAASSDPDESKTLGRQATLPDDWAERKRYIMLEIVTAKFSRHTTYRQRLLETGEQPIVELNSWGDTYWGADIDTGNGRNMLGQILMSVRSTLRVTTDA